MHFKMLFLFCIIVCSIFFYRLLFCWTVINLRSYTNSLYWIELREFYFGLNSAYVSWPEWLNKIQWMKVKALVLSACMCFLAGHLTHIVSPVLYLIFFFYWVPFGTLQGISRKFSWAVAYILARHSQVKISVSICHIRSDPSHDIAGCYDSRYGNSDRLIVNLGIYGET